MLPEIDSRHPDVLAVQAELDAGRVPERSTPLRARIRAALAARPGRGATPPVVIAHNALTLHKNLALTAALADLAAAGAAQFVAWCHDLAWTNPLYLPALHAGYPWDLLRTPLAGRDVRGRFPGSAARTGAACSAGRSEQVRRVPNGIDPARFLGASAEMSDLARAAGLARARSSCCWRRCA